MKQRWEDTDIIYKPWGWEGIIYEGEYLFKALHILPGEGTSVHYHEKKHETLYHKEGNGHIERYNEDGEKTEDFNLGLVMTDIIEPGEVHRIYAGGAGALIIEASTPHPDDVVRVRDPYDR